jgi:hypothetical protein
MLVLAIFVHLIYLCEKLLVRPMPKALEDPIDCWLEQGIIFFF